MLNELTAELLGAHALNPAVSSNSPSRNTMMTSHWSQRLTTRHMDIPLTLGGPEVEYSKYTTSSRIPCNARIIRVMERYPRLGTSNSLGFNPEHLVFFCDEDTGEYDYVSVPYHVSLHQYFGYQNVHTDVMNQLRPGTLVAKDTVLADTPANISGFYTSTTNLNVMLASEAGVAEDGIVICEDVLPKLAFDIFETRTFSVGTRKFPLNIGGEGEYKCLPDIGEEVDESGALVRLREYVPGLAAVMMSKHATREVDYTFDEIVYARQGTRGRVVDIKVTGNADTISALPKEMTTQLERYRQALIAHYKEILETERAMVRESHQRFGTKYPKITGNLQRLLVEARALSNHNRDKQNRSLQLLQNRNPLDEYQVTMTIQYTVIPDIGYKLTSVSGDKGVITSKLPRHRMPVDADGNSADIVMAPDGTVARTNYARGYLMYLGGAARDMTKRLRKMTGFDKEVSEEEIEYMDESDFNKVWNVLMEYYDCINPKFAAEMDSVSPKKKREHLYDCISFHVINMRDVGCQKPLPFAVQDLEAKFPQTFGPVTHAMITEGIYETTKDPIRIAPLPIMLLDKTTEDTLVAATAAHGPFGVLTKHNLTDRYSKPWKDSPARGLGESENRTYASHTKSPEMVAEMMDRANNPTVQLNIVREIIGSETPGNIDEFIDRDRLPFGSAKPLEIMYNYFQCYGATMRHVPEDMREAVTADLKAMTE